MVGESSLAQDFVAGLDPFGVYTSSYGQKAEEAGVSEGRHRTKKLVGAVGGAVGGGALVPSVVSGVSGALEAAAKGGSGKARLARAATGFLEGAKSPFKLLSAARTGKNLAAKASAGGDLKLTAAQAESLKSLLGRVSISDLAKGAKPKGNLLTRASGALEDVGSLKKLLRDGVLTQSLAKKIESPLRTGYMSGVAGLGIGATVGAGGAAVQYGKGRKSEKKFQQRLRRSTMQKYSSAASAAFWASYDLEVDKIASASKLKTILEDIAYAAGQKARKGRDVVDKATDMSKSKKRELYEEYMRGYQNRKKSRDDLKARMYMVPLAAGLGTGGALMLGKGLRKKEDSDVYSTPASYGEMY